MTVKMLNELGKGEKGKIVKIGGGGAIHRRLLDMGAPLIIALNMMDMAESRKYRIDGFFGWLGGFASGVSPEIPEGRLSVQQLPGDVIS